MVNFPVLYEWYLNSMMEKSYCLKTGEGLVVFELIEDKEELLKRHRLGPDAMEIEWTEFWQRLEDKKGKIKPLLMDIVL